MITAAVLWHLSVFRRRGENGGVITTSGSWSQIINQLVPALASHAHRFPRWDFQSRTINIDGVPNWMAFSTAQAGRAEGFHGHPEHPLMALLDEAKTIRDVIFRAVEDRCRPQRTGLFSSPGYALGHFYDSQTVNAALYKQHKITFEDCPWIDRNEMRRIALKAGAGHYERGVQDPLVQSAYFANFMPFVEDAIISHVDIAECLNDPPGLMHGPRHAFCDFAAGGDENCLAVVNGNRVTIEDSWRDTNTMSAAGRFLTHFQRLKKEIGLRPQEIEGDADGMGRPVVDRIREMGWEILDFHGGAQAFEPTNYKNRTSELWFEGALKIQQRKVILPDDRELAAQLTDRKGRYESSGLRWIESKDDLFKRQSKQGRVKRSPDRADAVLGAMGRLPMLEARSILEGGHKPGPWDNDPDIGPPQEEQMSVPEELLRGMDPGG
jgi:hypothetical protein